MSHRRTRRDALNLNFDRHAPDLRLAALTRARHNMSSTTSSIDAPPSPDAEGGHYQYKLYGNLYAALGGDLDMEDLILEQCLNIDASQTELEAIEHRLYHPPGGQALRQCLCGKPGIIEHNIILHGPTGMRFVVGSQCVMKFIKSLWESTQRELTLWKKCAKLRALDGGSAEEAEEAEEGRAAYDLQRMDCLRQAMKVAKDRRQGRPISDERAPTIRAHHADGTFTLKCESVAGARIHLSAAAALIRERQAYQPYFGEDAVDATIALGLRGHQQVMDHARLMVVACPLVMPPATWTPVLESPTDWALRWSPADGAYAVTCVARCPCGVTLTRAELLRDATNPDVAQQRTCDACFAKPVVALSLAYPSCGDASVAVCLHHPLSEWGWSMPTGAFLTAHYARIALHARREAELPPDAPIRMHPPRHLRGMALPALRAMTWKHPCPACGATRDVRVASGTQLRGVLDQACDLCDTRAYFAVPYDRKDDAKGRGARWDPEARQWYVLKASNFDVDGMRRLFGAPIQPRRRV